MGTGKVAAIRRQFLQLGVDADMPVAFVENGTTAAQRSLLCTVSTMHKVAADAAVTSPSIIYIGRAVAAATDLSWFEGSANAGGFSSLLEYEKVSAASM
jgi:siroheme synthase